MEIIDLTANTPGSVFGSRLIYPVSMGVLHDTSGKNDYNANSIPELNAALNATIRWFQGGGGLSIHYLIGPEALGGRIYKLCKEEFAAWHAVGNQGNYLGASVVNRKSIGIEVFGQPTDPAGPNQKAALLWLTADICRRYGKGPDFWVSHASIQDDRSDGNKFLAAVKANIAAGGGLSTGTSTSTAGTRPAGSAAGIVVMNGKALGGGFKLYWDKYNLPGQPHPLGLPISEEYRAAVPEDGKPVVRTIQIFERGILGYRPDLPAPYDVQPLLTGYDLLALYPHAE